MALVFTEEFNSTAGSPPSGWTLLHGAPVVQAGGYHGQCCFLSPSTDMVKGAGATLTSGSIFFVVDMSKEGNPASWFEASQAVVVGTSTSYSPIFSVGVGADRHIRAVDGQQGPICWSGHNAFSWRGEQRQWTFFQVDFTLTGGVGTIGVTLTIRVNGEVVATGSSTFSSSLSANFDTVEIIAPADVGTLIDSIYIYDVVASTPITTPNQGTPKARVSQAVLEHIDLPGQPNARVSQAVVEWLQMPVPAARVSQAVIELILSQSVGWRCYEC